MKIELGNKEATILEQRQMINGLQSEVIGLDGKYRGLQMSYFALQRNFAYQVEDQARVVDKINLERDSTFVQLVALKSSVEESKSKRLADVLALIKSNERLTKANGKIKYKLSLFKGHLEEWRIAFLELEIYSRGLESLLQVRGFSRVDMPSRPSPMFNVAVKRELAE